MLNGIFSTFSGKYVNGRRLEIISNNIANVSTPGFKALRPVFTSMTGEETAQKLENTFTSIYDAYSNFTAAPPIETGGNLDFAIEGDGFFVVSTKEGPMYTRNGKFTLDSEGKLVTSDGNPVLGKGGEITIDGKEISVESDGSLYVDKAFVDVLKVVDFAEKKDIRNYGKNLFVNTNEQNEEIIPENLSVRQGYYEGSNVDMMREMIELMYTVRAYEAYTKADRSLDDILGKLINMGR
ncbi:MAG: Flagellar basal-body rod protein FlgG [Syntrophorhabdus sp. PtaU1.Bin002]|nr:MAG: Flagellar basal-body rod protein FlgG [Syntrophorhabdus sp. PtaB.Bin006]OPY73577.1 MAG: Flagellar basal-body rod protein FlgG [Syntrophorhabdus sp. PtaU1.Bin002]